MKVTLKFKGQKTLEIGGKSRTSRFDVAMQASKCAICGKLFWHPITVPIEICSNCFMTNDPDRPDEGEAT